jgi:SAM-dependent methyltransferase
MAKHIDYCHAQNGHGQSGPLAAFPIVLGFLDARPASFLDVGCGTGTWLKAALAAGITDVRGVDGIVAPDEQLAVDRSYIQIKDLTQPLELNRKFELALCLEVAEHLDADDGDQLIESLTRQANTVVFSAACPHQLGQHHVNCQWPAYWQERFNRHGFACDDAVRWRLWNDPQIEVWYRQNMFIARRCKTAGAETRIHGVVHPELWNTYQAAGEASGGLLRRIRIGMLPVGWYLSLPITAAVGKIMRRLKLQ